MIETPPPDKPNTISNPLPQHNTSFCINQITLTPGQSILDFDPTLFITPHTEPKSVVKIPEETTLCFLGEWDNTWGDLISDWEEFESANFQGNVESPFEPGWEADWQNVHADPLDGFSLSMMFEGQNENYQIPQRVFEWGWDPTPSEYQHLAWDDPLDTFSLPTMFVEEY